MLEAYDSMQWPRGSAGSCTYFQLHPFVWRCSDSGLQSTVRALTLQRDTDLCTPWHEVLSIAAVCDSVSCTRATLDCLRCHPYGRAFIKRTRRSTQCFE
eukprot:15945648-Heterocapsa_arctica.AAC.1